MDTNSRKYEVDKEVIEKTTKCEGNFKCLETGECPKNKCIPIYSIDGFLLVKTNGKAHCDYHTSFLDEDYCYCPTRNAIYRKYQNNP